MEKDTEKLTKTLITPEDIEKLKSKKIEQTGARKEKIRKTALKVLVYGLAAIGAFTASKVIIDSFSSKNETELVSDQPDEIIEETNEDVLFDINNTDELITRGTDLVLDLRKSGYEISGEDALYFMLFAGNDNLKSEYVKQLNLNDLTENVITESVDKTIIAINGALIGGNSVSIAECFPNKEDQELLANMTNVLSHWSISDKQTVANASKELNDYLFRYGEYQKYSPQAVVTYIKTFRAFDELTRNSGYETTTDNVRNLIYLDSDCENTKDNNLSDVVIENRSIHSAQYEKVKARLNDMFQFHTEYTYSDIKDGVGYTIISQIDTNVRESGVKLGTPTNIQAERDKNDTTVYRDNPNHPNYVPEITDEQRSRIKKDPVTGEEYILDENVRIIDNSSNNDDAITIETPGNSDDVITIDSPEQSSGNIDSSYREYQGFHIDENTGLVYRQNEEGKMVPVLDENGNHFTISNEEESIGGKRK